ncbi:MAG: FAD-dependent oxidoreductase [Rhodothermales bacterium]
MAHVRTATIIGAGIGGLTAAVALRQVGIEVAVYERAVAFGEVGAGISLWPNATRVLQRLGVLDTITDHGGLIHDLTIRDPKGRILMRVPTDRYEVPSVCAYRPDLVEVLRAALPNGTVRLGHTLRGVKEDKESVIARFDDGATAISDILIGADGIRSAVRASVLGTAEPQFRGYPVWRGITTVPEGWQDGEVIESWGDGRRFGMLHTGQGRMYWYATANQPEGTRALSPEAEKAKVLNLFAEWHAPIPEVVASTSPEAVLCNDTYDLKPSRPWHRGRTVLIGDAIHATTPNLGQGGCTAIEDGWVLAKRIQAEPYERAFKAFENTRYRRTTRVTKQSRLIGQVGQWEGGAAHIRNGLTLGFPSPLYASGTRWLFDYGRYHSNLVDFS